MSSSSLGASDSDDSSDDSDDVNEDVKAESDDVNAEVEVDIVYDRNETNNTDAPSDDLKSIDLTEFPTGNPLVLGAMSIIGILIPLRRRI